MSSNAEYPAPVQPGDVLAQKYRVERVLGVGGMGVVVAATHIHLGQLVALKFLLPEMVVVPEAAARFAREARNAVRIQNEHVARVSDVGTLEGGAPYMVMEYLGGCDLSELVRRQGALPITEAIDYVLQATVAVAEAHALGIVHRDLKPANLFLADRSDGMKTVKVLDFGISKVTLDSTDAALTKTSTMMGSPLYMAPEQMRASRDVDARADIWALGVILYELLGGRTPFRGETMPQICAAVLAEPAPPLCNLRPDVPAGLEAVITRCLDKNPLQRFADVVEFASALLPFADKGSYAHAERASRLFAAHGVRASMVDIPQPASASAPTRRVSGVDAEATGVDADPTAITSGTVGSWSDTQPPMNSGSRTLVLALGALALAGVAGGAWFALRSPATSASATPAATVSAIAPSAAPPTTAPPEPNVAPAAPAPANAPASASAVAPAPAPAPAPVVHVAAAPVARPPAKPKPTAVAAAPVPAPAKPPPTAKPLPATPKNPLHIDIK